MDNLISDSDSNEYFFIEPNDFSFDIGGEESTTTVSTQWEIQGEQTITGETYTSGTKFTDDDTFNIGDIGTTSGNVKINPNPMSGTLKIGPDPEKQEKLEDLAEEQLEKVDRLRDIIINYISRNNLGRRETEQWKSDLDLIERFKRELKDALSGPTDGIQFGPGIGEEDILDPSQMDRLNDVYKRWT